MEVDSTLGGLRSEKKIKQELDNPRTTSQRKAYLQVMTRSANCRL